jgi:hypothetical protein
MSETSCPPVHDVSGDNWTCPSTVPVLGRDSGHSVQTKRTNAPTFTRCPDCGAIDWPPAWPVEHRPRCPMEHTTPTDWKRP